MIEKIASALGLRDFIRKTKRYSPAFVTNDDLATWVIKSGFSVYWKFNESSPALMSQAQQDRWQFADYDGYKEELEEALGI
jgi:hypothetical protein